MADILTPKKDDSTEKFAKKVVDAISSSIRKGGRRNLAQIVGTRVEFLYVTLNILDIQELERGELFEIHCLPF